MSENKMSENKTTELTDKEKLQKCKELMRGWAYLGYNGSPFTEKQAKHLQNSITNSMCENFVKIFGEKP